MRRERCPARKFARSVIARGRRQRPSHGHPAGRRPTVALGPPARNPLASERFSNNRPPSGRAIRYINKSLLPRTEAPNGTSSGSEPPDRPGPTASAKQMRQPSRTSRKNRRTAQERSVRRGSLRQPATDNRNPIVADRYPIGPAPPFHASSSKFSLSMADRSPRTSRGQTKKPTRFASAHRTAYRNRTSICRLRIYRPNR